MRSVALAEFGPGSAARPDLLDALQEKNEDLRLNAAIALGKIGQPAVKEVAKLLDAPDDNMRFYAVWTLGTIGPEAKSLAPTMIKLLADKNIDVRRKAAFAPGRMAGDPDATIAALVGAFQDERRGASGGGGGVVEIRQSRGSVLDRIAQERESGGAQQASASLGAIGAEAKARQKSAISDKALFDLAAWQDGESSFGGIGIGPRPPAWFPGSRRFLPPG